MVHSAEDGSIPGGAAADVAAWKLRGDRYSPNLRRWALKQVMPEIKVYRGNDDMLWIGWIDDGLWFIGSRLWRVLCTGARAEVGCWTFPVSELTEVDGFWGDYARIGRCSIDIDHSHRFIDGDGRWAEDGDARTCTWCGHQQARRTWTETVQRQKWESPASPIPNGYEAAGEVSPNLKAKAQGEGG